MVTGAVVLVALCGLLAAGPCTGQAVYLGRVPGGVGGRVVIRPVMYRVEERS